MTRVYPSGSFPADASGDPFVDGCPLPYLAADVTVTVLRCAPMPDDYGNPLARPHTLLIDSEQLESGEKLDQNFRAMASDEIGVAASIMDPQFWSSVKALVGQKLIAPDVNGVKESLMEVQHVFWAHRILTRVVRPMLRESTR